MYIHPLFGASPWRRVVPDSCPGQPTAVWRYTNASVKPSTVDFFPVTPGWLFQIQMLFGNASESYRARISSPHTVWHTLQHAAVMAASPLVEATAGYTCTEKYYRVVRINRNLCSTHQQLLIMGMSIMYVGTHGTVPPWLQLVTMAPCGFGITPVARM